MTKQPYRADGLQPDLQCRSAAPAQGRRRLPAHDQRREQRLSGRLRATSTGVRRTPALATNQNGTGTYGYYQVNDLGTRGQGRAPNIWSLYVQDAWSMGNRLVLNLGLRTENEKIPDVPVRHRAVRLQVRVRRQARAAPRRGVRRARRRPHESVGELGPLLRLDQVRAARAARSVATSGTVTRGRSTPLDIDSLNLSNMPGRDLFGGPLGFRGPRGTYDPEHRLRTSSRCTKTARASAGTIS